MGGLALIGVEPSEATTDTRMVKSCQSSRRSQESIQEGDKTTRVYSVPKPLTSRPHEEPNSPHRRRDPSPNWELPKPKAIVRPGSSHHPSSAPSVKSDSTVEQPPVKYVAYGPQGQVDTRYKARSVYSDMVSTTGTTTRNRPPTKSGWARPVR